MTIDGLEPVTDTRHAPAIEVAYGRLTLQEAYQRYEGMLLLCPHCLHEWGLRFQDHTTTEALLRLKTSPAMALWEQWRQLDIKPIAPLAATTPGVGLFPKDLHVQFRKGALNQDQTVKTWMHFFHTVPRADRTTKLPCHDPGCIDHTVALGAIQLMLEDEYRSQPDVTLIRESHLLLKPGETHLTRCPDLQVTRHGQLERLVEVQRSPLSQGDLVKRTQHLQSLCPRVEWYFFKGTYEAMGTQRRWLSDQGLVYYQLRWDGSRLRVEEGRPPQQRERRTARRNPQSTCVYTTVEDTAPWQRAPQAQRFLPLSVVGKAEFVQRQSSPSRAKPTTAAQKHQFPEWGCSVKNRVDVWVDGAWRPGVVKSYSQAYTPIVQVDKAIGRHKQRLIEPTQPSDLRPSSAAAPTAAMDDGQMNLFP